MVEDGVVVNLRKAFKFKKLRPKRCVGTWGRRRKAMTTSFCDPQRWYPFPKSQTRGCTENEPMETTRWVGMQHRFAYAMFCTAATTTTKCRVRRH